jgi:dephospho-CoA kinase
MMIVAITGMPGAGKSTAAMALEKLGMKRIVMGDVIRTETRRRGLEANEKNTGDVMKDLRAKYGAGAVAEVCLQQMKENKSDRFVVDGIRSVEELEVFRREGKVLVLGVHASMYRRYQLLKERGRSDDPVSWKMFRSRDERELKIGVGNAIALADELVSNEHNSPENLQKQVTQLISEWMKKIE